MLPAKRPATYWGGGGGGTHCGGHAAYRGYYYTHCSGTPMGPLWPAHYVPLLPPTYLSLMELERCFPNFISFNGRFDIMRRYRGSVGWMMWKDLAKARWQSLRYCLWVLWVYVSVLFVCLVKMEKYLAKAWLLAFHSCFGFLWHSLETIRLHNWDYVEKKFFEFQFGKVCKIKVEAIFFPKDSTAPLGF